MSPKNMLTCGLWCAPGKPNMQVYLKKLVDEIKNIYERGYYFYSGAPARAKSAWDRAPYSWNMVNLFSFGCHVTDRAYVRVYRLYGWGRGDYQKGGRGVSGVSWQVLIFYI